MTAEPVDEWTDHACTYPEVVIERVDEGENELSAGMKVLTPCPECGETPLDYLGWLKADADESKQALLDVMPTRILYHWSPSSRRKQIIRYGLMPSSRSTTSTAAAPVICFADSPSWAWALSGEQRRHPVGGSWDLWQCRLDALEEPVVLAGTDRLSGIYEVRTEHRVFKRHLWLVGSRTK